jgi:molecular chaperone DnaK (HSP70)
VPRTKGDAIGIDLGTTNTVVALNSHVVSLRPESTGDSPTTLLPSVISFPPSGAELVGEPALERRVTDPLNTVISSKRVIGEAWGSYGVSKFRECCALHLVKASGGGVAFQTRAGTSTPEHVATAVVATALRRAGLRPAELDAVVAVPTAFVSSNCEATRAAVARTGLAAVKVIHEPVATTLAYLTRSSLRFAAVFDLGGGTFDVSIVDCTATPLRVVASAGDLYLGGDDIDRAIAHWVADQVLARQRWDLRSAPEVFAGLVAECERAKLRLAGDEVATVSIASVDPAAPAGLGSLALDRATALDLALPTIRRTFGVCDEVFEKARMRVSEVDAVFLAGGATALPGLREYVGQYFGKRPRIDVDPMHVVSIGASLCAIRSELVDFVPLACCADRPECS